LINRAHERRARSALSSSAAEEGAVRSAGEEIEGGSCGGWRAMRVSAAMMILAVVGDLTGLGVIVQAMECHRGVDAISDQALESLAVLGRQEFAPEHGEPRVSPGKEYIHQVLGGSNIDRKRSSSLLSVNRI
jgi:hypothetical protein